MMRLKKNDVTIYLLVLVLCCFTANVSATHISEPVLLDTDTYYLVGEKVVINGWVDYNAQPTADVLLNFQVTTQDGTVLAEESYPSDKQGHFQFEFDTKLQQPGTYKIIVTSHCREIHRNICSYNSETLTFELSNP